MPDPGEVPPNESRVVPLKLAPVTKDRARRYVGDVHRHNLPPGKTTIGQVAVIDDTGTLRGVAIWGIPSARNLTDGYTAEVLRVATDGATNACSMLYGACKRAAKAAGYRRLYTYTLQAETGASLRASGWTLDAELDARPGWAGSSVKRPRVEVDLFGNERTPTGPKYRWRIDL